MLLMDMTVVIVKWIVLRMVRKKRVGMRIEMKIHKCIQKMVMRVG